MSAVITAPSPFVIPRRLYPLRDHPEQLRLKDSLARFKVVPAGRRSGKTERAKRKLINVCMRFDENFDDPRYFAGAPTRDQAKQIYWADLKAMSPPEVLAEPPRESELTLVYKTGCILQVIGMDRPERIEGRPWNGGVLDEYANMKKEAFPENVRPALSDRNGWCWLIGVPEGRNHYYDLYKYARSGEDPEWDAFTWHSADILDPKEVASAKRQLDPLVFQQEYEASFINFVGRAYYPFLEETHCSTKLGYDRKAPLNFCFDFNVDPGVAVVTQEQELPNGLPGVGVIGEVYIPRNSNTPAVCRKLVEDWSDHLGAIRVFGDATGGSRGSAKVMGSDWELVKEVLYGAFGQSRVFFKVPTSNPTERVRINAMNSLLKNGADEIRLMVDPQLAPYTVKDLEGVRLLEGGSGEIDKKHDANLTHLSDALGYYVVKEFPLAAPVAKQRSMYQRKG